MWSKTLRHSFSEFCGHFGHLKGSNPDRTCLHCHGVEIKILKWLKKAFFTEFCPCVIFEGNQVCSSSKTGQDISLKTYY